MDLLIEDMLYTVYMKQYKWPDLWVKQLYSVDSVLVQRKARILNIDFQGSADRPFLLQIDDTLIFISALCHTMLCLIDIDKAMWLLSSQENCHIVMETILLRVHHLRATNKKTLNTFGDVLKISSMNINENGFLFLCKVFHLSYLQFYFVPHLFFMHIIICCIDFFFLCCTIHDKI